MPSLASGLLNGLASYQRGQAQGDERRQREEQMRFERERQLRAEERAGRLDAQQQTMMTAQLEQMRQAAAFRAQDQQRQNAADGRADFEGGYRAAPQVQQMGAAVGQMGEASTGPNAAVLSGVGRFLGDAAARPAFDRGGVGMVKAGESMREQERRTELQARQAESTAEADRRARERADDRAFTASENQKNRNATMTGISARLGAADGPMPPRTLPQGVESAISENSSVLGSVDEASRLMSAPKSNGAFGLVRGLQNTVGMANRLDPQGTEIRALVANLGSQQIKLRSGAAVTAAEWPRLQPWIPTTSDSPDEIRVKLKKMREIIGAETNARADYYEGQGYAVPSIPGRQSVQKGDAGAIVPPRQLGESAAQYMARTGIR